MDIFPAIDILGGEAVRLVRGDYGKRTVYSADPVSLAASFRERGAEYLHAVDLDGARDGVGANFPVIERLISESGLKVEVGGGVRSLDAAKRLLSAGAYRVILGTAALDGKFLRECVGEFGEKVAVGADIKDGRVAVKGWRESSGYTLDAFLEELSSAGVATVICTDTSRDGVLSGVDAGWYAGIASKFSGKVVASGGVKDVGDIKSLAGAGVSGVILGKSLYVGALTLEDALAAGKAL